VDIYVCTYIHCLVGKFAYEKLNHKIQRAADIYIVFSNYIIFKRLFIYFLLYMNRDFGKKISSNNFFNWISKYRHTLFRISRYSKVQSENDYIQDIEKLLKTTRI